MQNGHDIVAFITQDQTEIRVDSYVFERVPNRCRFSLAHELAHLLLHADLWQELSFDSIAKWKAVVADSIPEREYGYIEFHANFFAGLILVPQAALSAEFAQCVAMIRNAGLDPRDELSGAQDYAERYLADRFGVSSEVVHRRIEADSLWEAV